MATQVQVAEVGLELGPNHDLLQRQRPRRVRTGGCGPQARTPGPGQSVQSACRCQVLWSESRRQRPVECMGVWVTLHLYLFVRLSSVASYVAGDKGAEDPGVQKGTSGHIAGPVDTTEHGLESQLSLPCPRTGRGPQEHHRVRATHLLTFVGRKRVLLGVR